ncbi:MAG TPA: hypothetical protein VF939_10960 [Puia sp.]
MKASAERKLFRWIHILFSIPLIGYLYGPVAAKPYAAFATRWVFFPAVVVSGLWMWKGHIIKKWFRTNNCGSL